MSFEADEEILQDFLVEAGEILEELSSQLVALENDPQDMDLLNGIFRGFHTVKGGAGFLNLKPLVDICHITENIFDKLRNGDRIADAVLMDNILKSLDLVHDMFDAVRAGEPPQDAPADFLEHLGTFASSNDGSSVEVKPKPSVPKSPSKDDISDDEFEALLDELHGSGQINGSQTDDPAATGGSGATDDTLFFDVDAVEPAQSTASETSDSDDISDEEFEALLEQLHGGDGGGADAKKVDTISPMSSKHGEDITDDEFEKLLDELHGKTGQVGSKLDKSDKAVSANQTTSQQPSGAGRGDSINDTEFESLLDELHGAGKGPKGLGESTSKKAVEVVKTNKVPSKAVIPATKNMPQTTSNIKAKPVKKAAVITEATVRVDTKRLDEIMNMVGELVLARNRLKTVSSAMENNDDLAKAVSNLDIVTGDLQGAVMKTRMQPIKKVFGRFPRVVRDLARSLKKEITLEMDGEETDLDKNLVEALADPLVHLVRNSVDHGIEMPDEREKAGKPAMGSITLSAAQEGDHIMLVIKDDGKGMDPNILRELAVEKGLMDKEQSERLTNSECYNLIFLAGFSTKKEVSDISGRGVGMDVVKTKITQLNGSIDIESELGVGTKILIKVPLTLAILPTLMVKVRGHAFAFPLTAVNEIFHLDLTKTNTVDGQLMIVVRQKALPLFFLNEILSVASDEREREGHVVLAQIGTQTVGFVVDSLVGQEEVVIKPLGKSLQGTPGMAGATITSDGKIALILDIPSLLRNYIG